MARGTYGAIITDIVGSIGGTTFQHNHAGKILRTRPMRRQQGGVLFSSTEPSLLKRKAEWSLLTVVQKASWNTYAGLYTKDNYYSETKTLNGFNWFVSINNNLERVGSATISTAPARVAPLAVPVMTLNVDGNGIWFTPAASYALGNNALVIFTTTKISSLFTKQRSLFRYTDCQESGTVDGYNLKTVWETAHGLTYPTSTAEIVFNIAAMFIHIEKTSGQATVGTFAIDGVNTLVGGIGNMIIGNNFIVT